MAMTPGWESLDDLVCLGIPILFSFPPTTQAAKEQGCLYYLADSQTMLDPFVHV